MYTYTENNALTYATTGSAVLDFFSRSGAMRGNDEEVVGLFDAAYDEDPIDAVLAAFYLRDPRGGQGERMLGRACFARLYERDAAVFDAVVGLIPEYGRWDDLTVFLHRIPSVQETVRSQFYCDLEVGSSASLLAKWLPSPKTSSGSTRALARFWMDVLGLRESDYRKALSFLRSKLNVVERDMSANRWEAVNYSSVPSRAMKTYSRAFRRHDEARFREFLTQVSEGRAKINAGQIYPYELAHNILEGRDVETSLALWNALPDYTQGKSGLVLPDVSGSMTCARIPGSSCWALDVSVSLALYYAQRNTGPWRGKILGFSKEPYFLDVSDMNTRDALAYIREHGGLNTALQPVVDLLIFTAKGFNVPSDGLPALWIISDMEFDAAASGNEKTNLQVMREKFERAGFKQPPIIFWNVASRNAQAPALKDHSGVTLISGFSPVLFKSAMEDAAVTPMAAMRKILFSDRYIPLLDKLEAVW